MRLKLRIEVEKVEEVQWEMKETKIKIRIISIFKVTNLSLFCRLFILLTLFLFIFILFIS